MIISEIENKNEKKPHAVVHEDMQASFSTVT